MPSTGFSFHSYRAHRSQLYRQYIFDFQLDVTSLLPYTRVYYASKRAYQFDRARRLASK